LRAKAMIITIELTNNFFALFPEIGF